MQSCPFFGSVDQHNLSSNELCQSVVLDCDQLRQNFSQVYPVKEWKESGFFVEEDLLDIDCHWFQFEPVRPSVHFTLAILYVIFFIVGFFSNALVIYVILSSKKLFTPANILLVNLAVSDLLVISMVPIFVYNSFHQGPAIGKMGCTIYGFVSGLSGTCSIMSLAAIAIDRFLVISRPLQLDRKPTHYRSILTSLSTWIYSASFASLPLFGVGNYVPEGYLTSCSFDYLSEDWTNRIFILTFFIGAWVVPLCIIIYSYSAIIRAVVYVRQNLVDSSSAVNAEHSEDVRGSLLHISDCKSKRKSIRKKRKHSPQFKGINQPNVEIAIARITMGLIATWMVAWTPYALVALAGISGYAHLITPSSAMLPALFAKSAACIDPFIYALNHPKIRQEIFFRIYKRYFPNIMMPSASRRAAVSLACQSNQVDDDDNNRANCDNMEVVPLNFSRKNRNQFISSSRRDERNKIRSPHPRAAFSVRSILPGTITQKSADCVGQRAAHQNVRTRPAAAAAALDCNSIYSSENNGSVDHDCALNEEGIQLCELTNGEISTSSLFNDQKWDVVVEIND